MTNSMSNWEINGSAHNKSKLIRQCAQVCSSRRSTVEAVLYSAVTLLKNRNQSTVIHIGRLINDTLPHISRIDQKRREEATDFNVFTVLGITRNELIQSRFLAYLLSTSEHHKQGKLFLNAFLSLIDPCIQVGSAHRVHVSRERAAGNGSGRMDIVIECKPDWLVVIENKLDASEGDAQLSRYSNWLKKQNFHKKKYLVFLTPSGREAVTGERDSYKRLSYIDLAEVFHPLLDQITQESVRTVIAQYILTCYLIGGVNMVALDKELQDLLTKPENVRATLQIERQATLFRKQVAKDFGRSIETILQGKISENGNLNKTWRAYSETYADGQTNVGIKTHRHQYTPNYRMVAECVFTNGGKGWYGWYRPQWVDVKQPHETATLTENMIQNGIAGGMEGWWIAWNNLRDGNLGYVITDIDDIIACWNDNRSDHHSLANEIANEMWTMFINYRERIEALDSFKQANA
jgi:hypothetical protein